MAFPWFMSFTRTTRRWLRQQTSGHHALVTHSDSGRLPVTIHALVTKQQATRATNTAHACAARFVASTSDHWHDRQRFITIAALFSHSWKTLDWTRTHRHTAHQLWRRTPPSTSVFVPRIRLQYAPVFPALHAIFEGLFKASCFPTVSLNNELFCQYYSSAAFTSRRQANQSSTVSLSCHW